MDSKIIVNHFAPDQSIEDSLKFLEGDGEVANEDMGAPNGNDVEGVDQLQGAAALVPTSTSTSILLLPLGFSNPMLLSLY